MPSMMNSAILALAASVATVSAHGFVDEIIADGVKYTGYLVNSYPYQATAPETIGWSETATDLGFATSVTGADIICHNGAKNGAISAPVKAGGNVDLHWNTWPESHKGPVINYMANCGTSCATVDKTTLKWFKISESGLLDNSAAPGKWASDALMANNLTGSVTIPSSIAAGNYVLRHEMIALHSAGSAGGAQNYPFCVNLEVTGGGSDAPEGVVGTSLYTATDPGILVSIYTAGLDYKIPGPALYAGGSGSSSPVASSAAAPVPSATSAAPVTSSAAPAAEATSAPASVPTTLATLVRSSTTAAAPVATATPDEESETCE